MSDIDDFLEALERDSLSSVGMTRVEHENPGEGTVSCFVTDGHVTLFAVATADHNCDGVMLTIHAFRDGERAAPTVMSLGDEVIISL